MCRAFSATSLGDPRPSGVAAFDKETGALASWNPFGTGSGYVNDLLLDAGVVYLGGTFSDVGGQPRSHLAAADAVTGVVTSWDPNVTGFFSSVSTMCADGGTIYFSGRFDAVGTGPEKVRRENFRRGGSGDGAGCAGRAAVCGRGR
jgi:hypothetical protein